jgi:glutathione S-transferase
MKLYAAPRTRAVRIAWLLEELELPYDLEVVEFKPTTSRFFIQNTPTGKIPTLEDGDVVMCESGAIVEYILEKYGEGRLAPRPGTPERAAYLQWLHFAEATAFPPLGVVIWLTVYRDDAEDYPQVVGDARYRVLTVLDQVEDRLNEVEYLAGSEFTAADIMMGFTLFVALTLGFLEDRPNLKDYLTRLQEREGMQNALARLPLT